MGKLPPCGRVLGIDIVRGCCHPVDGAAVGRSGIDPGHLLAQVLSTVLHRLDRREAEGTQKSAVRKQHATSEKLG